MQSQSSKSSVTTLRERIDWFNKAVISEFKLAIKIDKNSRWPILNRFFLSTSFGYVLQTASSLIAVLKVIDSAYKLVDASNQRTKAFEAVLPFFGTNTNGVVNITIESNSSLTINGQSINDVIEQLQGKLDTELNLKGKNGEIRKSIKKQRKQIKQVIAALEFRRDHPDFANQIDNAKNDAAKKAILCKFLEEQIATTALKAGFKAEKKNKIAKDMCKEQGKKKIYWRNLIMAAMLLFKYTVKPFLWIMGSILGASAIATLTAFLTICSSIVVAGVILVNFGISWYNLFSGVNAAARSHLELSKKDWSDLSLKNYAKATFRCFFTQGFYGDAANNIKILSVQIVLVALSLSFIGISSPSIIVVFNAIALVGAIIVLVGKVHKEINKADNKTFTAVAEAAIPEICKILLCAGILAVLSFVALASVPVASTIVGAALVCGITYVAAKWSNNSIAQELPKVDIEGGTSPKDHSIVADGDKSVPVPPAPYTVSFSVPSPVASVLPAGSLTA